MLTLCNVVTYVTLCKVLALLLLLLCDVKERFKTGGRPANKDTEQLYKLLKGIMKNQQPLENIPDDDHLDSSDEGSHTPELSIVVH